jgi:hypothetical protein
VGGAAVASRRREASTFARDPGCAYEVAADEDAPGFANVNWGHYGLRSTGADVVRWTTGTPLATAAAQRLFALGEEVCAAVNDYARRVRPGDTAGVRAAGPLLSQVLAGMGRGRELRVLATALADGAFEIRNYDLTDDWRAIVGLS